MNNLDHTETIVRKVAASDESRTINNDSSATMIPPAGAENLNEDDDIWNWVSQIRLEEFHPEDLNFLTLQKPPEFCNNAYQFPSEFGHHANPKLQREQYPNLSEAKLNTLSPELRSLILWQLENVGFKVEAGVERGALGKAPLKDDITNINQLVGGDATVKNTKWKGIEVDDNYECNARVLRRGGTFEYHTHPGRKSIYSNNDKLMALHQLVPGSQKADMATTLGETVEYLAQVNMREHLLQEEVKRLRHAIHMIFMHSNVHRHMNSPMGTPLNMGVNTQSGGLESRSWVHPRMRTFNSSMSGRMNKPSVMPSLLQQNSAAAAASRLFLSPQVPEPSQQQ